MVAKKLIKLGRMQPVVDYAAIIFGCFLVALGLDLFLIPNRITAGGVSGISTILFHRWVFQWACPCWGLTACFFWSP